MNLLFWGAGKLTVAPLEKSRVHKYKFAKFITLFPRGSQYPQGASTDNEFTEGSAGDYVSLTRRLLKSSGIYALGAVMSPLISLVLAPFLAHNLSRTEYGALAVLTTAIALLAGTSQLGLGSAFFRSYNYDYESQRDRLGILSTVVILLSLTSIPLTIAVISAAPRLSILLLRDPSLSNPVRLTALAILLQNFTVPGFARLRAENRAAFFVALSIASLLITLGGTVVLVGRLNLGIVGSLIATGGGYAFVVACTLPSILLRAGVRPRFDIAWGLLTFGVPNVFNFIAMWVLQVSDRFLLAHLGSLAQTAGYAVAYSLGGGIGVVVLAPFLLAWPSFVFAIAKRPDASHVFQLVFRWYSLVLLFATYAFSLVGIAVLYIFFPPAYHSASSLIPIIAVSIMFYGLYNFVGLGVSIRRKTWLAVVFTTLSALVNLGLDIFLIPRYGAVGAAVSTLVAYIVLASICYIVTQRIYPVPFEIGIFLLALLVGTVLYIGSEFLGEGLGTFGAWGISIGSLGLYSGCLILLGMVLNRSRRYKTPTSTRGFCVMKTVSRIGASAAKDTIVARPPVKVCMYVRGTARSDGRVMREATSLVGAGIAISIVDIERESPRSPQEEISGVHIEHIFQSGSFISTRFKPWSLAKTIQSHIYSAYRLLQISADIYHAHDVTALPACYIAARSRRKPLIFDAHELPLSELESTYWYRFRGLFKQFLTLLMPRCAGVITVSPPIAREIRNHYHAQDVALVRNIPTYQKVLKGDRLRQHLKLGPGVRIALYQGNLQPNRGLERLIRAATFLHQDNVIVLMGKGVSTTRSQLEALITREGVADHVRILPPVPYAELLDWTASADIGLIVYSPDHSLNVQMCLPNKLFEYLMAGLPVLTSQLDAVAEVIRTYEVGQVVPSLTPADLGAAINTMLADCAALTCMRHNALEAAQRDLYWEKEQHQLICLYQNILAMRDT
jgi:O-antigen/teichoic acid export membrane protein/glycosyltransferase involved in cell wall biosynthesis